MSLLPPLIKMRNLCYSRKCPQPTYLHLNKAHTLPHMYSVHLFVCMKVVRIREKQMLEIDEINFVSFVT